MYEFAAQSIKERAVFWVKADTKDNFITDFLATGAALGSAIKSSESASSKLHSIKQNLESADAKPWLLIID